MNTRICLPELPETMPPGFYKIEMDFQHMGGGNWRIDNESLVKTEVPVPLERVLPREAAIGDLAAKFLVVGFIVLFASRAAYRRGLAARPAQVRLEELESSDDRSKDG